MTPPNFEAQGPVRFRLGQVLQERMSKEGSFAALARAITLANRDGTSSSRKKPRDAIDRRKLKSLVEGGKGAVLTFDDLCALDRYLEVFGEGLSSRPILQKPDLMQALASCGRLTFLIGSRPEEDRGVVSHWDVLAMAEIQRELGLSEVGPRLDIQTVPVDLNFEVARKALERHDALGLLDDNGPSLVCLGSARSNLFAELMLCRMFGYAAFKGADLPDGANPPFFLAWNPSLQYLCPSHFHVGPEALMTHSAHDAELVRNNEASILVASGKHYTDRVTPRKWGETYGLCIAQRRPRGQVWLLLLGITGVSTYVAAKHANRLATRLNESPHGQTSDIYWGIVSGKVAKEQRQDLIHLRELAEEQIEAQGAVPAPEEAPL